jgi:hypothetical protein
MKGKLMPNFELASDEVATITILVRDAGGDVVSAPSGDTFSVTSSLPNSLAATIGADAHGAPAVVLTPLVVASPGISISVSDSAGLAAFTQVVDVVADTTPKAIGLDLATVEETPQATPTNPGP